MIDDESLLLARARARRRQRILVVVGVFFIALALALWSLRDARLNFLPPSLAAVVPAFLGLGGVTYLLLAYLRYDPELAEMAAYRHIIKQSEATFQPEINSPEPPTQHVPEMPFSPAGDADGSLDERGSDDLLISEGPFSADNDALSNEEIITRLFADTQRRLRREIAALDRRGTLNLVFGVVITIVGIGLLVYLVIRQHPITEDIPGILSYYLPRLSTVALVEAFSYFFLGLYKSNLEEIKYYQNERTTATLLQIAWRASLGNEQSKTGSFVIRQLAQADRNANVPIGGTKKSSGSIDLVALIKAVTKLASDTSGAKEKE